MARKIVETVPEEVMQEDLKKYERRAVELGASEAKIIPADLVVIDERVRAKCMHPKCPSYGTNANCPPHTLDPDETRKLVSKYKYAILIRFTAPTEWVAGKPTPEQQASVEALRLKRYEVVGRLEKEAFLDGYYLATAFGGSACKGIFCKNDECRVLKGLSCRAPYKARSSMEAVGIDVYMTETKAGWDIYPIARGPSDAPHLSYCGIVFIC